jgi:hypothetical protein
LHTIASDGSVMDGIERYVYLAWEDADLNDF